MQVKNSNTQKAAEMKDAHHDGNRSGFAHENNEVQFDLSPRWWSCRESLQNGMIFDINMSIYINVYYYRTWYHLHHWYHIEYSIHAAKIISIIAAVGQETLTLLWQRLDTILKSIWPWLWPQHSYSLRRYNIIQHPWLFNPSTKHIWLWQIFDLPGLTRRLSRIALLYEIILPNIEIEWHGCWRIQPSPWLLTADSDQRLPWWGSSRYRTT